MMTKEDLTRFLGWCSVINLGLMLFSYSMILLMGDLIGTIYSTLHNIPMEVMEPMIISLIGLWKIIVIFFNVIPYFVLKYFINKRA